MPRFVILEHDHPMVHWDLMLEAGSILRTWRLEAPPPLSLPGSGGDKGGGGWVAATAVFDHRLLYLDYEGPISGGRGRVVRWEHGSFTGQVQGQGPIVVRLQGQRLHGVLRLEQTEGDSWRAEFRAGEETS